MSNFDTATNALIAMLGDVYPDMPYSEMRIDCRNALTSAWIDLQKKYKLKTEENTVAPAMPEDERRIMRKTAARNAEANAEPQD